MGRNMNDKHSILLVLEENTVVANSNNVVKAAQIQYGLVQHSTRSYPSLVNHFTEILTHIKIQMAKLKCQMNVKAQSSKCLTAISIFGIW